MFCESVDATHRRNDFSLEPRAAGHRELRTTEAFVVRDETCRDIRRDMRLMRELKTTEAFVVRGYACVIQRRDTCLIRRRDTCIIDRRPDACRCVTLLVMCAISAMASSTRTMTRSTPVIIAN